MKIYSKEGVEMMDVKTIALNGETLIVKGKMMGAMAAVIHVRPEDIWDAFTLLPTGAKLRMPMMLWKGWRASLRRRPPNAKTG